jgi:hypothetical protein
MQSPMTPISMLGRAAACLVLAATPALAALAPADNATDAGAALRAKYAASRVRLETSPYGRPVLLDSRELDHDLEGDAYIVLAHPFARVAAALAPVGHWCEVLMLPFNTKHCQAVEAPDASTLTLFVGRKNETPVERAYRLDFRYAVAAQQRDYLRLVLTSDAGPLGTRNYRIALEATPLGDGRTFVKLGYSYGYGTLSRVAMQTYLATLGARKVGFSTVDGELVRGMRGVMERNTMRYALALEAYLDSFAAPQELRLRKLLDEWFTATERYPRQLHEMGREEYVAMKQREFSRGRRTASWSP